MSNANIQQSPALRIEAGSINCILLYVPFYAENSQFIDHSESLSAHYVEYLLLLRLILLNHMIRRTPKTLTEGAGRMMTDTSGASQLTYKPYGEVNRMNSYGPDIFRYKYTSQQDDQDTGLYYYNARYYDPVLGSFTSADNVTNATSAFGLNHYMYTEGNPVRYGDASGNFLGALLFSAIATTVTAVAVGAVVTEAVVSTAALTIGVTALAAGGLATGLAVAAGATALVAVGMGIGAGLSVGITTIASALAIGGFAVGMALVAGATTVGATLIAGGLASSFSLNIAITAIGMGFATLAAIGFTIGVAVSSVLVASAVPSSLALTTGATILGEGALAIGSILSPLTLQSYVGGGLSTSSWNKLRWDEIRARRSGCYAAAGQDIAAHIGAASTGGIIASYQAWSTTYWMPATGFSNGQLFSIGMALFDVSQGNFDEAQMGLIGMFTNSPVGIAYSMGKRIQSSCNRIN